MSAMRGRRRKMSPLLTVLVLATSLLFPASATALQFKSAPATKWGLIQAAEGSSASLNTAPRAANLEGDRKSEWRVKFVGFPEEAKAAVVYALDIWARNFTSKVPINVEAIWGDYRSSAILGSARPGFFFSAFPGAPDETLWYPSALANVLAGKDLNPSQAEIVLRVNSSVNKWYLATDGNPESNEYDLVSVVLHEVAHGLGFLSNAEYDRFFGTGYMFQPTPFDAYAQTVDGRALADFCARSADLGKALINPIYWSGSEAARANGGIRPRLYTPTPFEDGSSVTHLDEALFSNSPEDSMMTPSLEAGEVFKSPGPIVLGMIEDMLNTPPRAIPSDLPATPTGVQALIGDRYALITLDTPSCSRLAKVTSYRITAIPSGQTRTFQSMPATFSGLQNGKTYRFQVTAQNDRGSSETVESNAVKLQAVGKSRVIDPYSQVSYLTSIEYKGRPIIFYNDARTQRLKSATFINNEWRISTIRKEVNVGRISACKSGSGSKSELHLFYAELERKDLLYSHLKSGKWTSSTVDGNGEDIQDYKESVRRKTASDVSVSNACAVTESGVQVFYRDESQGILLGALKSVDGWIYEIVDGDSEFGGRTTGDVAFNLSAVSFGKSVYLLYDSVLTINANGVITSGEVRTATRASAFPEDWSYSTLDGPDSGSAVAGYATALYSDKEQILAAWLTKTVTNISSPNQVAYSDLKNNSDIQSFRRSDFGLFAKPISIKANVIALGCAYRLCAYNFVKGDMRLMSGVASESHCSQFIQVKKRGLLATSTKGLLVLLEL